MNTKTLKTTGSYLAWNIFWITLLYFGTFGGKHEALSVLTVLIWFDFVIYGLCAFAPADVSKQLEENRKSNAIPHVGRCLVEIAIACVLAWHSHNLLAGIVLATMVFAAKHEPKKEN